jgi:hypothetical protein
MVAEIFQENETIKVYWHHRDLLCLRDGVMYRRTSDEMDQMLMPMARREEFLKLAHTGVTGVIWVFAARHGRCDAGRTG